MEALRSIYITLFITALCAHNGMGGPMADPDPGLNVKVDVNVNGGGGLGGGSKEDNHDSEEHGTCNKDCGHWCYPGKDWPCTCPWYCNGTLQSPIDICSKSAQVAITGSIIFSSSYSDPIPDLEIKNNGHTVGASWSSSLSPRTITGGGLGGVYELAQFHFHWGCKDYRGSEHTVDGTRYAMELHFVHYNTAYGNLSNALNYADGLAVLGVFFNVGADNAVLDPITANLHKVDHPGTAITISFNQALIDLIPANREYYRYQGSLTTPTCNEVVIWTVYKTPLSFSQDQVKDFRRLMGHEGHMCDNYRGIQPLNGREVQFYSP